MQKILIVDDVDINREILKEVFQKDYEVLEAENGIEAYKIIQELENEISVILLDVVMPEMDGFTFLEKAKEFDVTTKIPVILITGEGTPAAEARGYDMGVSDFIAKPFNPYIVRKRVKNIVELFDYKNKLEERVAMQTEKIRKQAYELKETSHRVTDTLSTLVEFRDLESGSHTKRIRDFTAALLKVIAEKYPKYNLTQEKIDLISEASVMHDVGKIAISDAILLKPGRLTKEEFDIMKTHTTQGCHIIDAIDYIQDKEYLKYAYEICRSHHERFDGKGYPDGLSGDEIPLSAQAVSVADVYDALVTDRVYKAAFDKETAFNMIINGECGTFPPEMMECFKIAKPEFERLADEL